MRKPRILVAEREAAFRRYLRRRLLGEGFEVVESSDATDLAVFYQERVPDLVIIRTLRQNAWEGLNAAEFIRHRLRKVPINLISRQTSEAMLMAALKVHASDYLNIPFSIEELFATVTKNLPEPFQQSLSHHESDVIASLGDLIMIGKSTPMRKIRDHIPSIAATDSTFLITGETGTGKELVSELVQRYSSRGHKPFLCINCAALPDNLLESELFGYQKGALTGAIGLKRGKLELAEAGTVFFDEIGDTSFFAQAKIFRAIERKEISRLGGKGNIPLDVRVMASTNQEPEQLMRIGKLRRDLYYRLNVARIHLPPLRERKQDILPLLEFYVQDLNRRFGRHVERFAEEALSFLLGYDWLGNVRELKNLIEATFINQFGRSIAVDDLPELFRSWLERAQGMQKSERDQVLAALYATNWNKSKAAQRLQWSRMTLYRKMAKFKIVAG